MDEWTYVKYVCEDAEYEAMIVDQGKVETEPGVEIYYEVYGEGSEKLLLVMGLGGTGAIWLPNVKFLLEKDENLQICIYDNRGIGRSSVPPGRYKTSIMAQDAIKVVDHLGWDKFHVAGISMGGMISQEIALAPNTKGRVLSLHLAVTHSGGPGSFPPWAGIRGTLAGNRAKTLEEKAPITMGLLYPQAFLDKKLEDGSTLKDLAVKRYIAGATKLPVNPKGFRSQVLAVQTHSIGSKRLQMLKNLRIPTLICTGDCDSLVNPKASAFLRSVLEPVEFIVWKGCGHGVLCQEFDNYNNSILRHYKRAYPNQSDSVIEQTDEAISETVDA